MPFSAWISPKMSSECHGSGDSGPGGACDFKLRVTAHPQIPRPPCKSQPLCPNRTSLTSQPLLSAPRHHPVSPVSAPQQPAVGSGNARGGGRRGVIQGAMLLGRGAMPPAHPSETPRAGLCPCCTRGSLGARAGAALSGEKPTCLSSSAPRCALRADKGHLSSAARGGHPPGLGGPRSPTLPGTPPPAAKGTRGVPPPSGHPGSPGTCSAGTQGHLGSVLAHRRAKSWRRVCQVSARERARWQRGGHGGIP